MAENLVDLTSSTTTTPQEKQSSVTSNEQLLNVEVSMPARHSSPGESTDTEKRHGVVDFKGFANLQEFDPISSSHSEETLSANSLVAERAENSRLGVFNERSLARNSAPGNLSTEQTQQSSYKIDNGSDALASEFAASGSFVYVRNDSSGFAGGAFEYNRFDADLEKTAKKELEQLEKEKEKNLSKPEGNSIFYPQLELSDDFHGIARHRILSVSGADKSGRLVIVFSASRIPPLHCIDHHALFLYMKYTLDQYVESDYTIVYFHYGLTSKNKPSFSWLHQIYKELDRKYRKNVKALFIVHPSNFIKILWGFFRKIASLKFAKKVTYINYLQELAEHVQLNQIDIPTEVTEHDARIAVRYKPKVGQSVFHATLPEIPKTQQFGVALAWLREVNDGEMVPRTIRVAVEYIIQNGLDVEGIFRRSANSKIVKDVAIMFNLGLHVDFNEHGDVHCAAAIIKKFLRELPEPLLTYELCDIASSVIAIKDRDEKLMESWRVLHNILPEENFVLLKYIMEFLQEVQKHPDNKMTSSNLAIVFGPNLMWGRDPASSLDSMAQTNTFTCLVLENTSYLFSDGKTNGS